MASLQGIVSSIKSMPDPRENVYTIIGGKSAQFMSGTLLALGDVVAIDVPADANGPSVPMVTSPKIMGAVHIDEIDSSLSKRVAAVSTGARWPSSIGALNDAMASCAESMRGALHDCAAIFLRALLSGSPIVVRFHNDGDGACGAMGVQASLSRLINEEFFGQRQVMWRMHKGVSYSEDSLNDDLAHFSQFESFTRPLVLIIDFGTTQESDAALVRAAGVIDILWIDHHPPYQGFDRARVKCYVNPWDHGCGSDFTAGALACVFARSMHECDVDDFIRASLVSDYSSYADRTDAKAMETAALLDFLTSGSRAHGISSPTPQAFIDVLSDQDRRAELLATARGMLDEAFSIAMGDLKHYTGTAGIDVYALSFERIAELGNGYPMPGRFSSRLQELLEAKNRGKTLTMVYQGSYISIRMSRDIAGSVNLQGMISRLKYASEYIESGGGHNEAGSIKVSKEHMDHVLRLLLAELGVRQ